MADPLKLVLFIDAQNAYKGAREHFFSRNDPSPSGQVDPVKLGGLIETRGGPNGAACALVGVRVYTGRPDWSRDPKSYAAHMRQCAKWEARGAQVIWRQLRYPRDWPRLKAEEKGIDVALAIDFVTLAIDEAYDIGVIMSTDTDMVPALEFVRTRYAGVRHAASAAWRSPKGGSRSLSRPGSGVWCHWLKLTDYYAVADLTNYARRP